MRTPRTQADICDRLGIGLEDLVVIDAFNGIGFQTEQGLFGICMRDRGIEATLDGVLVWASYDSPDLTAIERHRCANVVQEVPRRRRSRPPLDDRPHPGPDVPAQPGDTPMTPEQLAEIYWGALRGVLPVHVATINPHLPIATPAPALEIIPWARVDEETRASHIAVAARVLEQAEPDECSRCREMSPENPDAQETRTEKHTGVVCLPAPADTAEVDGRTVVTLCGFLWPETDEELIPTSTLVRSVADCPRCLELSADWPAGQAP